MKTVSTALKAHFAGAVTTLATCWRIVRLDGTIFAFTTFDQDLVISGITYSSVAGLTRTAIATGSTGEVDNLETVGFFAPSAVTEQDLKNGLFDYSSIYVFCVNWAALTQGICMLRRGWIGEVTRSPSGAFHAELRGMTQALVQETGAVWSAICRADLGDSQCGIPIKPGAWAPNQAVVLNQYVQAATQSSDALLQAIFQTAAAGTTGATEPTWDTTVGNTTTDNGIAWVSKPFWRILAAVVSPLSAKAFTTSALAFPAAPTATAIQAQGAILVENNVQAGTTITITDGTVSHSYDEVFNRSAADFVTDFTTWLNQISDWQITYTFANNVFYFTNNAATAGDITKASDTQNAIVIWNFVSNPIDGGTLTWLSGSNAGRSMEVKFYDQATNTVTLWLSMFFPIQAGDRFMIYAGCNKRRDTCFVTFNNILNFRGEPDMPGLDKVLSTPNI